MKFLEHIVGIILTYIGCYVFVLLTGADNNTLCIGFIIVMVGSPILLVLTNIERLTGNKKND